nr:hypothetical protein [Tanacetum cinerariifolium]
CCCEASSVGGVAGERGRLECIVDQLLESTLFKRRVDPSYSLEQMPKRVNRGIYSALVYLLVLFVPSVSLIMSEEDQTIDIVALPKFDMPSYESSMSAKDVKSFAIRHGIPLDLHPVALTKGWTMDQLSDDTIGLRAIPDAMTWRHHDSDISDSVSEDDFSEQDVQTLAERVIDLCPYFLVSRFLFAMVTMSEYLRFPIMSGATIKKGRAPTNQDQRAHHTVPPLSVGQAIPDKTGHRKEVEVEDPKIVATRERKARVAAKKRKKKKQGGDGEEGSRPKTKRRKAVARKDEPAASEATSSSEHIRTLNPTQPSGALAATTESREDRSPRVSPHDSANHSVHNYSDAHHDDETNSLRLGSSNDQSGWALTNVNTEVIQPSPTHHHAYRSPTVERMATLLRTAPQGANTEAGESSRESVFYVPEWSIHRRCRVDTPMWCRELMTDVLERFENLQANFGRLAESHAESGYMAGKLVQASLDLEHSSHLYTSLSNRYKAFKSNHEGCAGKIEGLENHNRELSQVNKDQALRIKDLEDELARKDSALVYTERLNVERAQEKEKLVTQLSKTKMEKFDCIHKLLLTVVERLLQSHEYKHSLSEPFNLAIQVEQGKGLSEERS